MVGFYDFDKVSKFWWFVKVGFVKVLSNCQSFNCCQITAGLSNHGRFVKVLRVCQSSRSQERLYQCQRFEGLSNFWVIVKLSIVCQSFECLSKYWFSDFRPSIGILDEFDNCTNTGFYDAYPGWSLEFEIMQNHQQLCQWVIYNANPSSSFTLTVSDMEVSLTSNFKVNFIRDFLDWVLLWQILCQC